MIACEVTAVIKFQSLYQCIKNAERILSGAFPVALELSKAEDKNIKWPKI
jgi:hypothetical protein